MTDRRCSACGHALEARLQEVVDPETREVFSIHECVECGLGHTLPLPTDLGPYYGPAYHGGRHGWTARMCIRRRFRLLSSCVQAPGTLLDIGCGDGSFLRTCARHGWRAAGTELGEALPGGVAGEIEVRRTIADFDPGERFTAATAWHSLEHLDDPAGALRALRSRMTPGGTVLVAVPNNASVQARVFGSRWLHLDVPRHVHHFDPRSLRRLLEACGFRVVEQRFGELEYDAFGWLQSALDSVLPTPRVLFRALTGKPAGAGAATVMASAVLGGVLGLPAVALTGLESWRRRSGTLVVVARAMG